MHFCAMSVRNALDEAAWAFFGGMLINFYARYLFLLFCAVIPFEQVSIPSISNRHILMWRFDVVPAHLWRQTMSAAIIVLINDKEAYLISIAGKICHLSLLILVFAAITRHPAATATFSLCRSITLNILPVHRKQFSAPNLSSHLQSPHSFSILIFSTSSPPSSDRADRSTYVSDAVTIRSSIALDSPEVVAALRERLRAATNNLHAE